MNENIKIKLLVHDLKSPLTVIDLGARSLKAREAKYGPLTPRHQAALDHVLQQTTSLRREIDSILSAGRSARLPGAGWLKRFIKRRGTAKRSTMTAQAAGPPSATQQVLLATEDRLSRVSEGIRLFDQAGLKSGGLTAEQATVVKRLKRNVKLCRILIGNAKLLAFPDGVENTPQAVRLGDAVRGPLVEIFDLHDGLTADHIASFTRTEDLKNLVAKGGLELRVEAELLNRHCVLDKGKFGQIMVNLLLNAFKFRKKTVWLSLHRSGQNLVLRVADDGRGMTRDILTAVREERFVDVADTDFPIQSHGIGLSGARLLIEEMGGKLEIESTLGQGSTFSVILPFCRANG